MRRLHVAISMAVAITAMACATTADEDPVDGINEPGVAGLILSGSVTEIVTTSAGRPNPNIQFNIRITIANNAASTSSVTYRTSCPVRLQLHSMGTTPAKVYDESERACDAGLSTVSVESGRQHTLFSGIRFPGNVLGDSLSPGVYRVVAVLQRDNAPLSVDAGTYNIPLCESDIGCRLVTSGSGARR